VRTRRNLAEDRRLAADEQLHAEHAAAAERGGDLGRDLLRLPQGDGRHRVRLPGLAIVAVDLQVADGLAEAGAPGVAHRQQGDLVVEGNEALDDDAPGAGAAAGLGIGPGPGDLVFRLHRALALAGG